MSSRLEARASAIRNFLVFLGLAVVASIGFASDCLTIPLQNQPGWISSAAWVPSRNFVAAVAPFSNKLLSIALDGTVSEPDLKLGSREIFFGSIARFSDGFLVRATGDKFVKMSGLLEYQSISNFSALDLESNKGIGSIYQWSVGSNELFGFGSLVKPGDDFDLGFFRTPIQSPLSARMAMKFAEADYYRLGYPFTAGNEDQFFFLTMGDTIHLYRSSEKGEPQELKLPLPDAFKKAPAFQTKLTGPSSAVARFKELESLSIPAGIYFFDSQLYILTRNPMGKLTSWTLYKLDPQTGDLKGSMRLPTTINHLTVVTSPGRWLLLERGPVSGPAQYQEVPSILSIDSNAIKRLQTIRSCPVIVKK